MEVRLKEAAKWLNENGYKDDLADIASITMKRVAVSFIKVIIYLFASILH